eukprot:scaffold635_cov53-Phaeocystis_antarctica.AAC.2
MAKSCKSSKPNRRCDSTTKLVSSPCTTARFFLSGRRSRVAQTRNPSPDITHPLYTAKAVPNPVIYTAPGRGCLLQSRR